MENTCQLPESVTKYADMEYLPMHRKPTVYIVDRELQTLEAITQLINPLEAEVFTYSRVEDFLREFDYKGPACLVLDVRLPDMSGLVLQSKLAQAGCKIPVIIITGDADVRMAVDAMKAGAVNFFEKPFRPHDLFEQIQKTLRADIEIWQRIAEEQSIERKLETLDRRQREVLDLVAAGMSNEEIAQKLHLSVRGIEARRAKAMKILRVDSKSELLELLRIVNHQRSNASSNE
jgi:two-component system, LuxR family, response regulator FixJ